MLFICLNHDNWYSILIGGFLQLFCGPPQKVLFSIQCLYMERLPTIGMISKMVKLRVYLVGLCILWKTSKTRKYFCSIFPSRVDLLIFGFYPASAVDIENPDVSIHSRAKHSMDYSQKIILHAGDALYIPEGWYDVGTCLFIFWHA